MEHEPDVSWINPEEFTEIEWAAIMARARRIHSNGGFRGNQQRCIVAAFVEWCMAIPEEFAAPMEEDERVQ